METTTSSPKTLPIRPLGEKIFVRRRTAEETTRGGLIIPEMARERCTDGVVLRVGDGKLLPNGKTRPLDVKVGQRVWFTKYSGTDFKHDGDDVVQLYEADVLAVTDE